MCHYPSIPHTLIDVCCRRGPQRCRASRRKLRRSLCISQPIICLIQLKLGRWAEFSQKSFDCYEKSMFLLPQALQGIWSPLLSALWPSQLKGSQVPVLKVPHNWQCHSGPLGCPASKTHNRPAIVGRMYLSFELEKRAFWPSSLTTQGSAQRRYVESMTPVHYPSPSCELSSTL